VVAGSPDPNNGHGVAGVGYTSEGVIIDTWGMTGLMTDAAIAQYAMQAAGGELYTAISRDGLNKATQPVNADFKRECEVDHMRAPQPVL
jgi:hypothetical protein